MSRGPGQEEQQRRDRAPDDAGGFSDLEKLSKKGPRPGKCRLQEELESNWGKVAEGGLELGRQGQVPRHAVRPVGKHMSWGGEAHVVGKGSLCQVRCQYHAAGPVETESVRKTGAGAVGRVRMLSQGLS